jgi:hypothetical protein
LGEQVPDNDDPSLRPLPGFDRPVPLFGQTALVAQVQRFLTDAPVPEHHGVVLLVDEQGAELAMALKTTSGWMIDLHGGYRWASEWSGGIRIARSW